MNSCAKDSFGEIQHSDIKNMKYFMWTLRDVVRNIFIRIILGVINAIKIYFPAKKAITFPSVFVTNLNSSIFVPLCTDPKQQDVLLL